MKRPVAILLGPHREAVSGVSTHLNLLFASRLADEFSLVHFQVGSEGRTEGGIGRLVRLVVSLLSLALSVLARGAAIIHLNTSLNARAFWRDAAYVVVSKLCGARVLLQVHGGALREFAGRGRPLGGWVRRVLRWPDLVVVLSSRERDAYGELVPGQVVEVVPNGIDCAPYQRHDRLPSDPQAPLRLVYVGRLAPSKGLFEIIEALRMARGRGCPARLVIAGSGPEEARLRQRVREAGLAREVTFAGPVDGDDKARLLSLSDILVLPSYSEGLPYALLEAMAAGVVPLVTPVGAIPDVIEEGVHGAFVAPRDPQPLARALAALAADRAALAYMSAACRRRIDAAYSIDRMAGDLSALYLTLLPPGLLRSSGPRPDAERAPERQAEPRKAAVDC